MRKIKGGRRENDEEKDEAGPPMSQKPKSLPPHLEFHTHFAGYILAPGTRSSLGTSPLGAPWPLGVVGAGIVLIIDYLRWSGLESRGYRLR